jgi:DNA-directed RNA polymerase subunit RPC12/RpoP
MENCINHPEREASSICYNCGNPYCQDCLTEGGEYYYCKKPACQEAKKIKIASEQSIQIICPSCRSTIETNKDEQKKKLVRCPECDSLINIAFKPPEIVKDDKYVQILASMNQGDLGIIKSMLDDGGIDYFVNGENFLAVDPLIQPAKIMVREDQVDDANEIIKNFELHIFGVSSNQNDDEDDQEPQ